MVAAPPGKQRRLERVRGLADGAVLPRERLVAALEALIAPGDRVVLEGNNQKQADFLSRSLARVDPGKLHDLHMIMPSVGRPEHLDLFELGIARKLDFSFSGPQSLRIGQLLEDGLLEIGAIHTYIELYARLVVDLIPNVALVAGFVADREGNVYTGPSTEDTPALVEPTAFSDGIVIVQVNRIVDDPRDLPRVDIPASWVDFVVEADQPFYIEPLFTRDPRHIKPVHVLMAMMAIRGIYQRHNVQSLNHGIGFNTAAIELILPTYGESLGLKGKICRHWTLNPHPTLIPAIESGWVESVHCFGTELGMEGYIAQRPDVFFTGRDGSLRSNRMFCQLAGQYAVDLFIGATLQVDGDGHSSTVTRGRLAGFGGAPNMGHDPRGRRHSTPAWLDMRGEPEALLERGRKLVVQMVETFQDGGKPTFVERLDALEVARQTGMPLAPVMIYGDDVTHVLTEEGIAYLYKARSLEERQAMIAAVAGISPIGLRHDPRETQRMRREGLIALPEDLGIRRTDASRELLAAKSIAELVEWSGGLYQPPARFQELVMNAIANLAATPCADLGECLADLAVDALIDEAELSPKPALVDRRGNGAHADLHLGLMQASALSLWPCFKEMADAAQRHGRIDARLRGVLGQLGRDGEAAMLRTTEGVNTHRGAIWALGLLVAAAALEPRRTQAGEVAARAGRIALLDDPAAAIGDSHGERVRRRYGVGGAREEARLGFPRAVRHGLPQLWRSREGGAGEQNARLDALLAIMSVLDDTCVLHRAGRVGLAVMQDGARAVLAAGGSASLAGRRRLCELDRRLLALNASPGGAADLLAACLFLDRLPAVSGGWAGSL